MINLRKSLSVGLPVLALSFMTASAHANLVTNGDFSSLNGPNSSYFVTAAPTGWSDTAPGFSFTWVAPASTPGASLPAPLDGTPGGTAPTGNIVEDDGGPFPGTISQTLSGLTAGDYYTVTFLQAAGEQLPSSDATTEQWKVTFGTGTTPQFSPLMTTPSGQTSPWTSVSLTFLADASSDVLSFLSVGTPSGDPPMVLLGDVSVVPGTAPLPEPSSVALMGAAILGLVAFRRRRA